MLMKASTAASMSAIAFASILGIGNRTAVAAARAGAAAATGTEEKPPTGTAETDAVTVTVVVAGAGPFTLAGMCQLDQIRYDPGIHTFLLPLAVDRSCAKLDVFNRDDGLVLRRHRVLDTIVPIDPQQVRVLQRICGLSYQ
ncbi:hypothetical protein [Rugamonas rubra]|uniref:hypothetical protein n=1 Tax=Rugamonas rubra TaxID=758825 RepID=UPI0011133E5E|nr:hypothetical protein [Rugamonas rubra]